MQNLKNDLFFVEQKLKKLFKSILELNKNKIIFIYNKIKKLKLNFAVNLILNNLKLFN